MRASSLMPVKSLRPYWAIAPCVLDYHNSRVWMDGRVRPISDVYDVHGTGGITPNGFYFVKGGSLTLIPKFEDPRFPLLTSWPWP